MTGKECRVAYDNMMVLADGSITFCDHYGQVGTIDDDPRAVWGSARLTGYARPHEPLQPPLQLPHQLLLRRTHRPRVPGAGGRSK
ncbi:MAG: hypothetical protein M5R36_04250 [Deltaproteobacteria bacterium]|nr:hypothetical protein [Deltaproteobacteria bacterium]